MRPDFLEWMQPDAMASSVSVWSDELGNRALRGGVGQDYRDAFVAARFSIGRAERVRMLRTNVERTPDFAIFASGVESWFEITEADRPMRKRNLEYPVGVEPTQELVPYQDHEWTDPDDYLPLIKERVAKKVAQDYARCDGLILVSNAFPVARPHEMTSAWWRDGTSAARSRFSQVFVMLGGIFYAVWIDGAPVEAEIAEERTTGSFLLDQP
jgi:hypothetical protein